MITPRQWLGLDDQHLVDCGPSHRLERQTATAFSAMQAAAQADGIDMQIASSYRDFNRQLHIWNAKWRGERPLLTIQETLVDPQTLNDEQKMHAILLWSALPGASRHHWGTDLDVYDKAAVEANGQALRLEQSEYKPGGPCFALACWLTEHAERFGFHLPYREYTGGVAPEPWHLSHASETADMIDITILRKQLSGAMLEGKHVILNNLPSIVTRYTLNKGTV